MAVPNNAAYFHAAYTAAAAVYCSYALSLWVRWRKLRRLVRGKDHRE